MIAWNGAEFLPVGQIWSSYSCISRLSSSRCTPERLFAMARLSLVCNSMGDTVRDDVDHDRRKREGHETCTCRSRSSYVRPLVVRAKTSERIMPIDMNWMGSVQDFEKGISHQSLISWWWATRCRREQRKTRRRPRETMEDGYRNSNRLTIRAVLGAGVVVLPIIDCRRSRSWARILVNKWIGQLCSAMKSVPLLVTFLDRRHALLQAIVFTDVIGDLFF